MAEKIRILYLSASSWTMSRILVDEEAREISSKINEGLYRDRFELYQQPATQPADLQRLLLTYQPHIVHFSGHGNRKHQIVLAGPYGRPKSVDQQGLVDVFALYNSHLRLVLLNACFTKDQARSISEVVDYSIGTAKPIGDKAGVAFAGAFYRALGFGKSIKDAFESASAELALTKVPRSRGIELFIKKGVSERDPFPQIDSDLNLSRQWFHPSSVLKEGEVTFLNTIQQTVLVRGFDSMSVRRRDSLKRRYHARLDELVWSGCGTSRSTIRRDEMLNLQQHAMGNLNRKQSPFSKKVPGTRLGIKIDWREGSANSGKQSGRYGSSMRDGR